MYSKNYTYIHIHILFIYDQTCTNNDIKLFIVSFIICICIYNLTRVLIQYYFKRKRKLSEVIILASTPPDVDTQLN